MTEKSESLKILENLKFCVVDLETTGGHHETDKIIEIGLVKIENLQIKDQLSFIVDPEKKIPDFIQKLTSIRQKDTVGRPKIEDVISKITHFIGDDILVAHNISFDIPFLNHVVQKYLGKKLENKVICTNVMTKHLIPEITNSNLTYMGQLFNLSHSKAHRAKDDALATAQLLIRYCHIFAEKGLKKINQLYYPKNKFELDRIHFDRANSIEEIKHKLNSVEDTGHITFKGDNGLILAVIPLAKNLKDRSIIDDYLSCSDWKVISLNICHPFLESLFNLAFNFPKLNDMNKQKVLRYLEQIPHNSSPKVDIDRVDFIISNHLINEQYVSYNILNLQKPKGQIFKVPGQQKKMFISLMKQVNHFKNKQSSKRKHFVPKELKSIINSYLSQNESLFLLLKNNEIEGKKELFLEKVIQFAQNSNFKSNFPQKHL